MSNPSGTTTRNRILVAGALAAGSVVGAEFAALSPWGSNGFLLWKMVVIFAGLAVVIAVILTFMRLAIAIVLRRARFYWMNLFVAWVACALLLVGGIYGTGIVRESQFMALATRSEPLIAAIEAYALARGSPPPDLRSLVPEYLAEVPSTGMGAYPEYKYYVPGAANNPWTIVVHTPAGILDFDHFLYLPNGNYEENGIGVPKRMASWAYIYE